MNDSVFALAHAGSLEYAGGPFTHGQRQRRRAAAAAAFDARAPATPTSWNPQALLATARTRARVYSLAPSASTMYMSGVFRTVGGPWTGGACARRASSARRSPPSRSTTGAPNTTWAPGADDLVSSIALVAAGPRRSAASSRRSASRRRGTLPVNPDEPGATYRGGFALVRALPERPRP